MKKYTLLFLTENHQTARSLSFSVVTLKVMAALGCLLFGLAVFVLSDYFAMRAMRGRYSEAIRQQQHMHSEAKHVMTQLHIARQQLEKVDGYMETLNELVSFKVDRISQKAGIGPLTEKEEQIYHQNQLKDTTPDHQGSSSVGALGISFEDFVFKPFLEQIHSVDRMAHRQSNSLKQLLLSLQQKQHLFSAIPLGKPVKGWLTSGYGYRISPFTGTRRMHYGVDIAARVGSPVYAPADGVVIFSGTKSGFGRFLMIAHDHGIVTKYGHNSELFVRSGDKIKRGDPIASVGNTGRSTGPHLHYEIWVNGRPRNPKKFLFETDLAWNFMESETKL